MQTIIWAGLLIDGTGGPPVTDAGLLIEHGRIGKVGPAAEIVPSSSSAATVLDYSDATVLPGFIDSHAHLTFSAGPDHATVRAVLEQEATAGLLAARALHNAQLALRAGVTTVRDCGAKGLVVLRVRDAIAAGMATGPRILACGMPITTTGGHMHYCGMRADSETEVRKSVRWLIQQGADAIKIVASGGQMTAGSNPLQPQYPASVLRTAVQEAHRLGRRVVAHALNAASIRDCAEAGVDTIDHCAWSGPDGSVQYDPHLAARLIDAGTTIGLTGSGILRELLPERGGDVADLRRRLDSHRRLHEARARVVVHRDAGVRYTPFDEFALSLRVMEEGLGASRTDVLCAATARAAEAVGLANQVGTIEVGKCADLLVINGNPLEDLRHLRSVRHVLRDGRVLVNGGQLVGAPGGADG
jgi:imidazolonepropionase-like amidohydrolase